MAYDPELANKLREALRGLSIREVKMFGGLCFLHQGNMVCGVHRGGALFRVGKPGVAEALTLPGARPMEMAGRTMAGFVEAGAEATSDPVLFDELLTLALSFVKTLPPK